MINRSLVKISALFVFALFLCQSVFVQEAKAQTYPANAVVLGQRDVAGTTLQPFGSAVAVNPANSGVIIRCYYTVGGDVTSGSSKKIINYSKYKDIYPGQDAYEGYSSAFEDTEPPKEYNVYSNFVRQEVIPL